MIVDWTVQDVSKWLKTNGFDNFERNFVENRIDGKCLVMADHEMLKALEIDGFSHRMRLLKSIRELFDENTQLVTDTQSLKLTASKNDKTIDELTIQIDEVKKEIKKLKILNPEKIFTIITKSKTESLSPKDLKLIEVQIFGYDDICVYIGDQDISRNVIVELLKQLNIHSQWRDYCLLIKVSKKSINFLTIEFVYIKHYESIMNTCKNIIPDVDFPTIILQHVRKCPNPVSAPLNLEPGTFLAATLGTGTIAKGVGIFRHEAQSREENDVVIGAIYAIVARDGEWCVIEKDGHRSSVPSICLAEENEPSLRVPAICTSEYHRKSGKEISLDKGDQVLVLQVFQHWCKVQNNEQIGFVPFNYLILKYSGYLEKSPKTNEKYQQMSQHIDFWHLKLQRSNMDPSLKKLVHNAEELLKYLFDPSKPALELSTTGLKREQISEKIEDFCFTNLQKKQEYQTLSNQNEEYDLVRAMVRKNYSLLMKLVNLILKDAKISSAVDINFHH